MTPKKLVSWTLAVAFSFFVVLASFAMTHDIFITDFPRLRALYSIERQLFSSIFIMLFAAVPATFLVFMFGGNRGALEFSILGIKVKGVAAPPVLWVLVFLSVAAVLTVGGRVAGQW